MIDDAFIDSVNSLNSIYNPEPPPSGILYHYTDFAGLQGILESHALRATYNRVLNDASEQLHAERVLCEELGLLKGSPATEAVSFGKRRHFVTCFCETNSLLSMWRGYAGSGGGFCLGFDYSCMKHHMCWPDPKVGQSLPLLAPVHYRNTPESIRRYLNAVCKSKVNADDLSVLPPFFPSMIKHEAFEEEREWRIIALDPPVELMKFTAGSANIRPFVELSWLHLGKPRGKLPLAEVIFGPTLRPQDRPAEIIGWMLEKNGYTGVAVRSSDIPFRL